MKDENYSPTELRISSYAKALAHPARLIILRQIAERGECNCGELVSALPLAQSTVSQHLAELKKARLITLRVKGAQSYYAINSDIFSKRARTAKHFADLIINPG